jgi:uncharacterized membrane protein YgcG
MMVPESEVPECVKVTHSKIWWLYMVCLMGVFVGRILALDILGALVTAIMALLVYYMLKDDCDRLSQCFLLLFGFMCLVNFFLEIIILIPALNGRSQHSTSEKRISGGKTQYTITEEKHAFFDGSMGPLYNLQSAMMIASAVSNLVGSLLSYWTYNAFQTSLFEDQDDVGWQNQNQGGYGGVNRQQQQPQYYQGGGHRLGGGGGGQAQQPRNATRLFGGPGQRLGAN